MKYLSLLLALSFLFACEEKDLIQDDSLTDIFHPTNFFAFDYASSINPNVLKHPKDYQEDNLRTMKIDIGMQPRAMQEVTIAAMKVLEQHLVTVDTAALQNYGNPVWNRARWSGYGGEAVMIVPFIKPSAKRVEALVYFWFGEGKRLMKTRIMPREEGLYAKEYRAEVASDKQWYDLLDLAAMEASLFENRVLTTLDLVNPVDPDWDYYQEISKGSEKSSDGPLVWFLNDCYLLSVGNNNADQCCRIVCDEGRYHSDSLPPPPFPPAPETDDG